MKDKELRSEVNYLKTRVDYLESYARQLSNDRHNMIVAINALAKQFGLEYVKETVNGETKEFYRQKS